MSKYEIYKGNISEGLKIYIDYKKNLKNNTIIYDNSHILNLLLTLEVHEGFVDYIDKNTNNENKLHKVKTPRNNLAHGNISFAECGRNYGIGQLRETKKEVILYLRNILRNIKKYLDERQYAI